MKKRFALCLAVGLFSQSVFAGETSQTANASDAADDMRGCTLNSQQLAALSLLGGELRTSDLRRTDSGNCELSVVFPAPKESTEEPPTIPVAGPPAKRLRAIVWPALIGF